MSKKTHDVCVKIQNGEYKNWKKIGAIIENDYGNQNIMLDKTFNPAAVAESDRENIILNCFPVKENNENEVNQEDIKKKLKGTKYDPDPAPKEADDDIPF